MKTGHSTHPCAPLVLIDSFDSIPLILPLFTLPVAALFLHCYPIDSFRFHLKIAGARALVRKSAFCNCVSTKIMFVIWFLAWTLSNAIVLLVSLYLIEVVGLIITIV